MQATEGRESGRGNIVFIGCVVLEKPLCELTDGATGCFGFARSFYPSEERLLER